MYKQSVSNLRVIRKLQKYFDTIWAKAIIDAEKIIIDVIKETIASRIESKADFKKYTDQGYDYYNRYYYSWKFEGNHEKYEFFAKEYQKTLETKFRSLNFEKGYEFGSISWGKSGNYETVEVILRFEPNSQEFDNLFEKYKKELEVEEGKIEKARQRRELREEQELLTISKTEALKKAKEELELAAPGFKYDFRTDKKDNYYESYIRPIVDTIAMKWGINPDELEDAVYKRDFITERIFCPNHGKLPPDNIEMKQDRRGLIERCTDCGRELVTEKHYKKEVEKEKLRELVIKTTLSRLPRFIYKVVKDIKVLFKKDTGDEGGHYAPMSNSITVRLKDYGDMSDYMKTLAHEYWHAFERATGFKGNLKDHFEETVNRIAIGDLGRNALEDFKVVIQTISYFGKEDFSEVLKQIQTGWGKKYFEKHHSAIAEDLKEIQQSVEDQNLYKTINELLAETLAEIVIQKKTRNIPQSLIVWMNKKFSSQNRDEIIIKSILKGAFHV